MYLYRPIHSFLRRTKEVYTHLHSLTSVISLFVLQIPVGLVIYIIGRPRECIALIQLSWGNGLFMKNEVKWSEVTKLCPTLCDSMDCSILCSSVCGIFQARVLEWVAISFFRESSWPRDRTQVFHTVGGHFTVWAKEKTFYRFHWFEKEICLKAMLAGTTESVIFLRRNSLAAFHPVFIFLFKQSYIFTVALIYHFYCMNHWVKCLNFRDIWGNVYSSMLWFPQGGPKPLGLLPYLLVLSTEMQWVSW